MSDPRTVTVYGASDDLIEIEGAMSNTDVEKAVAWLRTLDQHGTEQVAHLLETVAAERDTARRILGRILAAWLGKAALEVEESYLFDRPGMIYRDLPRVEFEVWPHVVCLEWSDGWKWTVRTFNGRSGDGSFVFDGSVVPSSGAGESAVDAARRALEAIRGEEGITS